MCDTTLATPASTAERAMLFGKNSDRQRNEAQAIELHPRATHPPGSQVACTYISIAQVTRTHAVLLSRPFWIWGAEMGANEFGVVIGNEGLHTRHPPPEEKALVGMDLLRLALERATTAAEALEVITSLLARHGQGGNCGHMSPSYYNNGFMIADANEGYVLETVGREWLVERVRGVRAISNTYSIGREVHDTSKGLATYLREAGWSTDPAPNYAEVIADPNREHIGFAGARRACSTSLMKSRDGRLTALDMMNVLRDHGSGDFDSTTWHLDSTLRRTVCMHAGASEIGGQTVGSLVSQVHSKDAVHWVTATAAPCTSLFKPVLLDAPLPSQGAHLTDKFDLETVWWRHERMHRAALKGDLQRFLEDIHEERDALEEQFYKRIAQVLNGGDSADRARVVAACWQEAMDTEARWYARLAQQHSEPRETAYHAAWAKLNETAGVHGI